MTSEDPRSSPRILSLTPNAGTHSAAPRRFEAMKTELRSEVKDVLSAEQRAEYEELIRNEPEHWRRGGKANREKTGSR